MSVYWRSLQARAVVGAPACGQLLTSNVVGPLSGVGFGKVKNRTRCVADISSAAPKDSRGSKRLVRERQLPSIEPQTSAFRRCVPEVGRRNPTLKRH